MGRVAMKTSDEFPETGGSFRRKPILRASALVVCQPWDVRSKGSSARIRRCFSLHLNYPMLRGFRESFRSGLIFLPSGLSGREYLSLPEGLTAYKCVVDRLTFREVETGSGGVWVVPASSRGGLREYLPCAANNVPNLVPRDWMSPPATRL